MYYLSEKCYKTIMVQYYITDCVSWAPRLTLLDLRNVLSEFNSEIFVCRGLTIHWSSDLQNKHASWDQVCTGLVSVTIDIAAPKAKHVCMWIWKLMTEKWICVCSSTWTAPVFLGSCKMNSHTSFSPPTDVVWSAADGWSSCPDRKAPLWLHSATTSRSKYHCHQRSGHYMLHLAA